MDFGGELDRMAGAAVDEQVGASGLEKLAGR
jgi:hypothetical protein